MNAPKKSPNQVTQEQRSNQTPTDFYPSKDFVYDISLKVKDGMYSMEIKELYLVSRGDDVGEVYKNLVTKEKEVRDEYEFRGALDDLPAPRRKSSSFARYIGSIEFKAFLVKSTIICGTLMLVLILTGSIMGNKLEEAKNKMEKVISQVNNNIAKVSRQANINIAKEAVTQKILDLGKTEMSPERKKLLLESTRKIVAKYKPIVNEAKLLFKDD
jgi:preprotein translocase subunit SecG